ncbi:MAG: metN [Francisellaceae bacterium]|nr:metN [Francisellaceae bacterium]
MISLQNVEYEYNDFQGSTQALKNINLEISPHSFLGILGRPGAGKSSLLRCVNLLINPSAGKVIVLDRNLGDLSQKELNVARRQIGLVTHNPNLLAGRNVYENIALPLEFAGASKREIDLTIRPILESVGLLERLELYPYQLTLLQKLMVSIARSLVNKPKILLIDEPSLELDAKSTQTLLPLIAAVHENYNLTTVLATRDLEIIKTLCKEVAVLHKGEIVEKDTLSKVFASPQSDITKDFIKTTTRSEMPAAIRRNLKSQYIEGYHFLLRLSFNEYASQDIIVNALIQNYNLHINIIQAHLETLINDKIGLLIIEVHGLGEDIQQGIQFIKEKGLQVEVLGYVPNTN